MYNCETAWADWMSHGIAVLMDGAWGPKMFFEPVPICSPRLSNIFLGTVYVWAFEFVDNPTLFKFVVPVLRCNKECFIVFVPLKCTCITLLLHVFFNFSLSPCTYGTTMEIFLLLLFS